MKADSRAEWTVATSVLRPIRIVLVIAVGFALAGIIVGVVQLWWALFYWLALAVAAPVCWLLTRRRELEGWSLSLVDDEFVLRRWLQRPKRWSVQELRRLYNATWIEHVDGNVIDHQEVTLAFEDGSSLRCSSTGKAKKVLPLIIERCPDVPISPTRFPGHDGPTAHSIATVGLDERAGDSQKVALVVFVPLVPALLLVGLAGMTTARPDVAPVSTSVVHAVLDPVVALVPGGPSGEGPPPRIGRASRSGCVTPHSDAWKAWDGDYHVSRYEWRTWSSEPSQFDEKAVVARAESLGFGPTTVPADDWLESEAGTDTIALGIEEADVAILLIINTPESYGGDRWARVEVNTPCLAGRDPAPEVTRSVRTIADYLLRGAGRP